jgi:hypothetical protein
LKGARPSSIVGAHISNLVAMVEDGSETFAQNKQFIDMLRRSRLFRDYEGVFSKATGLPIALRPLEYWQHEHHNKTNENPSAECWQNDRPH